jgi:hypothetical protein
MPHGRPNHVTTRAATKLKPREIRFFAKPVEETQKQEAQAEDKGEEDWSADYEDRLIHGKRS